MASVLGVERVLEKDELPVVVVGLQVVLCVRNHQADSLLVVVEIEPVKIEKIEEQLANRRLLFR